MTDIKTRQEALLMTQGQPHNQWAKCSSFEEAAFYVYGRGWEGEDVFVHWGGMGKYARLNPKAPYLIVRRSPSRSARHSCS